MSIDWRDRLARATFRGFEFLTDSHETSGGRRLAVHEFPGAEAPVVEDLGAKAPGYKLTAYFIGPDYDLERNRFIDLLTVPGASWLLHPWLGELWVRAQSWSIQESNDKGGYCAISLEFVPGGGADFDLARNGQATDFSDRTGWSWGIAPDKVDVAAASIRKTADVAVATYTTRPLSAAGMTAFVATVSGKLEGLRTVLAMATLPLTWAGQVQNLIGGIKGDIAALMALPGQYAAALRGLMDALGLDAPDEDLADTARPRLVTRLAGEAVAAAKGGAIDSSDMVVRANAAAEASLRGLLLTTAAAGAALATYQADGDRDSALASVVEAIDALLPGLPDPLFQAAAQMRADLITALLAQDLRPAVTREIVGALPATVLAHRLGVDETVFLARNLVRHPLFVRGRVYG